MEISMDEETDEEDFAAYLDRVFRDIHQLANLEEDLRCPLSPLDLDRGGPLPTPSNDCCPLSPLNTLGVGRGGPLPSSCNECCPLSPLDTLGVDRGGPLPSPSSDGSGVKAASSSADSAVGTSDGVPGVSEDSIEVEEPLVADNDAAERRKRLDVLEEVFQLLESIGKPGTAESRVEMERVGRRVGCPDCEALLARGRVEERRNKVNRRPGPVIKVIDSNGDQTIGHMVRHVELSSSHTPYRETSENDMTRFAVKEDQDQPDTVIVKETAILDDNQMFEPPATSTPSARPRKTLRFAAEPVSIPCTTDDCRDSPGDDDIVVIGEPPVPPARTRRRATSPVVSTRPPRPAQPSRRVVVSPHTVSPLGTTVSLKYPQRMEPVLPQHPHRTMPSPLARHMPPEPPRMHTRPLPSPNTSPLPRRPQGSNGRTVRRIPPVHSTPHRVSLPLLKRSGMLKMLLRLKSRWKGRTLKNNGPPDIFATPNLNNSPSGEATTPLSLVMYKCNVCQMAFSEHYFLVAHVKLRHRRPTLSPKYSCGACSARFYANRYLAKHCSFHHVTILGKPTPQCLKGRRIV